MNTTFELKKRSDIHYSRKMWHMLGVFSLFLIYNFGSDFLSRTVFLILFCMAVPFDLLRQSKPGLNDFLVHMFRPIMRQHEVKKLAGTSFLLTGVNIIIWIFPRPVVSLTLLFLAFADPIASYIGIKYGKDKVFGHKSIQGFMAAFVVCVISSFIYLYYNHHMVDRLVVISLVGGLIGALAELIPIGKIDDNLSLPILSSLGLSLLFYFFGFFSNIGIN